MPGVASRVDAILSLTKRLYERETRVNMKWIWFHNAASGLGLAGRCQDVLLIKCYKFLPVQKMNMCQLCPVDP
jgi:hypothetical protein